MNQPDSSTDSCYSYKPQPAIAEKRAPMEMLPLYREPAEDIPCCGPPAGPPSSPYERPGYRICHYVEKFIDTPAGTVPVVKTKWNQWDRWGAGGVRLGIRRDDYKVSPGLYAVGGPDAASPVFVSANYKLSFDTLREQLAGVDGWLLVLDTRGINVWCAAGKGTFGTQEVIRQVQSTGLAQVVAHRKLIVPQLGAVGVAAHAVKKGCGFEVVWGPIQAKDIKVFLSAGMVADGAMRRVSFTLGERLILVPVEVTLLRKYLLWTLLAAVIVSGIGSNVFSFSAAYHRGLAALGGLAAGVLAGCVLVPALLPWIPGRAFSLKGGIAGGGVGLSVAMAMIIGQIVSFWSGAALVLLIVSLSSFLAMNFTGATPFTSPSGVEKEMRFAIPMQLAVAVIGVGLWIAAGFR